MSPESSASATPKGWARNQVSFFSAAELSKKKSANILRSAMGHWYDYFLFSLIFGATFFAVFFILSGIEILVGEIFQAEAFVVTVGGALDNAMDLSFFSSAISIVNTIIAILVSLYALFFYVFYLIAEDGQTKGMKFAKIELFRKDGRELSTMGGMGGVGFVPSIILTVFYVIFLPVFAVLTYYQVDYSILWSFIEGFKTLDLVFAGASVGANVLLTLGYWLLSLAIILVGILVFGIVFHIIWLLAGIIANVIGKDEPEKEIVL